MFVSSLLTVFYREAAFQDLSVGTACLALLAGNYLAASKGKFTSIIFGEIIARFLKVICACKYVCLLRA